MIIEVVMTKGDIIKEMKMQDNILMIEDKIGICIQIEGKDFKMTEKCILIEDINKDSKEIKGITMIENYTLIEDTNKDNKDKTIIMILGKITKIDAISMIDLNPFPKITSLHFIEMLILMNINLNIIGINSNKNANKTQGHR